MGDHVAITTVPYCTREDVQRALDIKETTRNAPQIDRAISSAAPNIDRHLHRTFAPTDATHFWDWPNFQRAYPWRIWFDQYELADVTSNVPVVTSGGNVIAASGIFWGPWNDSPPFTFLELDRSKNGSFGQGPTPQRDVAITGTFGYRMDTDPGGTLAAAISSTTATTCTVSDGSLLGVGSLLIIDSERLLVSERATVTTGQSNTSGATTAKASDNAITVADGTQLHVQEEILIDSERMLITDVTGNVATVKRAWNGTVLATHSTSTTIYAYRSLTVQRGMNGTTAATHSNSAAISVFRYPPLIRDLAIAEGCYRLLQETSGYGEQGAAEYVAATIGAALPDLWDEAETVHGRKNRSRVV